ncbi:tetratricopeptide repeat protein [Sulfitobacter aestuariivivens]|uniref:Sel1 repeat family protein n=1 Tax=Sulfitobacter aestuariivivens TaxID=2766981 RepID=A0A927HET7_9RHOB|nr:tetratricopeptide repeat protein [Sulfitobacter aestuariivivens]MBD3664211.1 sel1 repeat family protein [Sulfitobacter aestuariivivens]
MKAFRNLCRVFSIQISMVCAALLLIHQAPAAAQNALDAQIEAAASGDLQAQLKVAQAYQYGLNVEKDVQEAIRWYEAAAAQESPLAMFELGSLVLDGIEGTDTSADAVAAERISIAWYRRAAQLGFAQAQSTLGLKYAFSNRIEKNPKAARMWIAAAKENGHKTTSVLVKRLERSMDRSEIGAAIEMAATCIQSGYTACE